MNTVRLPDHGNTGNVKGGEVVTGVVTTGRRGEALAALVGGTLLTAENLGFATRVVFTNRHGVKCRVFVTGGELAVR